MVDSSEIEKRGGSQLLQHYYGGSLIKALQYLYPDQNWYSLLGIFSDSSKNYWTELKNQKDFFDWVAKKLDILKPEDWVQRKEDIPQQANWLLQSFYNGSLHEALKTIYPAIDWSKVWKFETVPRWFDKAFQRDFFDKMAKDLKLSKPEDWYTVSFTELRLQDQAELYKHYGGSFVKALQAVYPEYNWKIFRFDKVPNNYWDNESHAKEYIEWLGSALDIVDFGDWFDISQEQIRLMRGKALLQKFNGLIPLLKHFYPNQPWGKQNKAISSRRKGQTFLFKTVQRVFPGMEVVLNYRHPELLYNKTSNKMELDVFVPSISLAFEFNGIQHYNWHYLFGNPEDQIQRDSEKKTACEEYGITLIGIHF